MQFKDLWYQNGLIFKKKKEKGAKGRIPKHPLCRQKMHTLERQMKKRTQATMQMMYRKSTLLNHILGQDLIWVLSDHLSDRSNNLLDGL